MVRISVRFDPSDPETPWHAQLDFWCVWSQAKTPGEAVEGILVAMRDSPEVYRDMLAEIGDHAAGEAALVEEAARQMKCDHCDQVGTEENPLVPVESSAAHPEGYVHGAGCPDAGPHHSDAHADSAPVG